MGKGSWSNHEGLNEWIEEMIDLCQPKEIHLCDGSDREWERLAREGVKAGRWIQLNEELRPNSFWCASTPEDVARVEESTFICSEKQEDAGPTNHWKDPSEMKAHLKELFRGSMRGRVMYIIPYCMGPIDSPFSILGVEISDSPYVVLNMQKMTRMGTQALLRLGSKGEFVPGLHSVGVPLNEGEKDLPWPCNPAKRVIAHFPEELSIFSFGSGYGGNALLGKKCLALRIASVMARDEGWLAEHMLILGVTSPEGEKLYFVAAFPSACGKTNLAMMKDALKGWNIQTVGDDIAWLHWKEDGRLYAINPESGYFGVAPGTSYKTNPYAVRALEKNALFTNVALTPGPDVWWEGMGTEMPEGTLSWEKKRVSPHEKAAHPNSRFTVSARQNPIYDPAAEDPEGVPISAILFGGRRASMLPLVYEAFDWPHGVFIGATLSSEKTAAAKGVVGELRHDPFAMLPFCGYHMGDYFAHWLAMGKGKGKILPKIYGVNWFQKGEDGNYLWPGFGENGRVLKWIFERCLNQAPAQKTPIGWIPDLQQFDVSNLHLSKKALQRLFAIDLPKWRLEMEEIGKFFDQFKEKMPEELCQVFGELKKRLV